MKHLALATFTLLGILCGTNAQAAPGDTLGISFGTTPQFSPNNQVTLVEYAGGYAYGVNFDNNNNFVGIGQGYPNDTPSDVAGVLCFIRRKQKGVNNVPNTKITFKLHNMVSDGASNIIPSPSSLEPTNGPDAAVLASKSMFFEEIDTAASTFNYIAFDSAVGVTGNMVVTVDLAEMRTAGDIIGFLSDVNGAAMGINFAFHQANIGGEIMWFTSATVFPGFLDNTIAIFPVIAADAPNAVLETSKSFQGVRALAMPNPANENLTIQLELSETANYSLELMNAQGKIVRELNLGGRTDGKYSIDIPVSDLASGQYFYSITSDKGVRFCRTVMLAH
jgi:hypothetical protein